MGNHVSQHCASGSDAFERKLRINGGRGRSASKSTSLLDVEGEDFCGIAKIQVLEAKLAKPMACFVTVSLGEQTSRTATSPVTKTPNWKAEQLLSLRIPGPRLASVALFESRPLWSNRQAERRGEVEINLGEVSKSWSDWKYLKDPREKDKIVGSIRISFQTETRESMERGFAQKLLSLMDYDGNGRLSFDEFKDLILAFGNKFSDDKIHSLYESADEDKDGTVCADELAKTLEGTLRQFLMNRCPVCGENLGETSSLNDVIHMSICFQENGGGTENGTAENIKMEGGFLTQQQASYGWMFKLTEWGQVSNYKLGLSDKGRAGHILVFERKSKKLIEELIDSKIVLAMRILYQSRLSRSLMEGSKGILHSISRKQGVAMDRTESAAHIPEFILFFKDQLDMSEVDGEISDFKTFNEFFVRKLKGGCRPIASPSTPGVAVCGADARATVFQTGQQAQKYWIKGKKFSLAGILGDEKLGSEFEGGSLAIFRLAPQDYHRFHVPVSGILSKVENIPGNLFTVNPIAVNSASCNVFTENKRSRIFIQSEIFGKVAFIAVGATMVGSITFTKEEGEEVEKGEELGYFSFGGSTVIVIFQKDRILFDSDLLANSVRSVETLVQMGSPLFLLFVVALNMGLCIYFNL